jgi:hypothetical protein
MFGGITVNENWREGYNAECVQLFGDLDILSFVCVSWFDWIGHANTLGSKGEVNQIFDNKSQQSHLGGRQKKTDFRSVHKQI